MADIDDSALDGMSVAPGESDGAPPAQHPRQEAGQDESIAQRLQRNPASEDAQLDNALDESMDASDPPANTQPASSEPAVSSGFDEDAEQALRDKAS